MFCTLFWCRIRKYVHFEGIYLFPLHQHTATSNITIWRYSRHINSTDWTLNDGDLARLFGLKPIQLRWVINTCLTFAVWFITSIYHSGQYRVTVLIVLHLVKRFVWYIYAFTQYSYYRDFFCLGTASCLCERPRYGWVHYIDTTKITILRFMWDSSVFIQYSYYPDFFCSGPVLLLLNRHHHVWVRYIDTTKIKVWCMP